MESSSNHRTTPYVILNNQSQQPSVSYSARQSDKKELNKPGNGIQTIVDTPLENPHIVIRSFYYFTRSIQVRLSVYSLKKKKR
jgi:hypothetical protein